MRKITVFFLIFFSLQAVFAQINNVTLLGQLDPYPGKKYTDCWGFTDSSGREYALMGVEDGTTIIDITNPIEPEEVAFIPGPIGPSYYWRDIKTHSHYAYVVSDNSGSSAGLQIIDLSQLPDTAFLVNNLQTYFTTSHNLYIDNGYAYVVGTSDGGGIHILDLADPENPVETAYFDSTGYVHDIYVWNDTAYASSRDTYDLIDVKDKAKPVLVSQSAALPGIYAHSGWLTEDKRYFIAAEEFNQRDITIWDLQDRTTWDLAVTQWQMPSNSRVHNVFVKDNYVHISYYAEGYVVMDISDPLNPALAGQYDTYPGNSSAFVGAWGCYPYFNSGNIIVSDISTGLHILDFVPSNPSDIDDYENSILSDYNLSQNFPNPFNPSTKINFTIHGNEFVSLEVFNFLGEKIMDLVNGNLTKGTHTVDFTPDDLSSGVYFAKISAGSFNSFIKMIYLK